jgi:hypothetical protein
MIPRATWFVSPGLSHVVSQWFRPKYKTDSEESFILYWYWHSTTLFFFNNKSWFIHPSGPNWVGGVIRGDYNEKCSHPSSARGHVLRHLYEYVRASDPQQHQPPPAVGSLFLAFFLLLQKLRRVSENGNRGEDARHVDRRGGI